jgi:dynein heavy chain
LDTLNKNGADIIVKVLDLGKKEEDYFETAKRYLLNDPKDLLDMLKNYDRDNINH